MHVVEPDSWGKDEDDGGAEVLTCLEADPFQYDVIGVKDRR